MSTSKAEKRHLELQKPYFLLSQEGSVFIIPMEAWRVGAILKLLCGLNYRSGRIQESAALPQACWLGGSSVSQSCVQTSTFSPLFFICKKKKQTGSCSGTTKDSPWNETMTTTHWITIVSFHGPSLSYIPVWKLGHSSSLLFVASSWMFQKPFFNLQRLPFSPRRRKRINQ